MNPLKKLAGQTAVYGVSSIVGRLLNYLLTPLYVTVFLPKQFGVVTEMYAYVAFLVVLLTYGMETAFFRYSSLPEYDRKKVFSTSLSTLFSSSALFILLAILFAHPIANWLRYPDHSEYVIWFALIVGLDAISTIPFSLLRIRNKPRMFAGINIINVLVNIGLNLFFLAYCKPHFEAGEHNFLIDTFYNNSIGVGYIFIANLIASAVKFLLLIPFMVTGLKRPEVKLLKELLVYAYPMLFVGLAGIVNETIDRILLKNVLWDTLGPDETMRQLGIYGANYKLAILITLFIQAYRYAAEPFFFNEEKKKNAKETYAKIMTYFVIVIMSIFLMVVLFLHFFKHFIPNEAYWEGLKIVPILLAANVCLGIYYNQSIWYKLSKRTKVGALISIIGAFITLVINLAFIPSFGYMASAWATLICYASMMVLSYFIGKYYYPIPYNIKRVALYMILAGVIYAVSLPFVPNTNFTILQYSYHGLLFLLFLTVAFVLERKKN